MEHIKYYRAIMNNLFLNESIPKITKRIDSMISKSNSDLLHMNTLFGSPVFKLNLDKSKINQSTNNRRNTINNKRKTFHLSPSKKKKLFEQSITDQSNIIYTFKFYRPKTRNKPKWPFNTPSSKTNQISNNNITETSTFLKTSLNNTSSICLNNSSTISRKRLPILGRAKQTKSKQFKALDNSVLNKTQQLKTIVNVNAPSPQRFSPYDTKYTTPCVIVKKNTNTNNKSRDNSKSKEYSLSSFRNKCNKIEKECTEVQKEVKNMPMKLIMDKKKFQRMMNECCKDDNDDKEMLEDLPGGDIKKIFTTTDLMNVSIKSNRLLLESKCVTKANPVLVFEAEKTIKNIFSIKPRVNHVNNYEEEKKKFNIQTDKMKVMLKKNLKANKECNEHLEKLKLKMKKKE